MAAANSPPKTPEMRQYKAVRFMACVQLHRKGHHEHQACHRRRESVSDVRTACTVLAHRAARPTHSIKQFSARRGDARSLRQQVSEAVTSLTPWAVQTENLQQTEPLSRLVQLEPFSLALSEPGTATSPRYSWRDRFFCAKSLNQQSYPNLQDSLHCLMIADTFHRYRLRKLVP